MHSPMNVKFDFLPIEICSVIWFIFLAVLYQFRNNRITIRGTRNTDNVGAQYLEFILCVISRVDELMSYVMDY